MRVALLILLTVSSALAQGPLGPVVSSWGFVPPAAGGGGSGAPGVLTSATNSAASVSSLSCTVTVSGANTLLLWCLDPYPDSVTVNTPTWNGSSTGVTLLTNTAWYDPTLAKMHVYYLASPSAATAAAAVSFGSTLTEGNLHVIVLTNAAGTFETATTNFIAAGVGDNKSVTNTVTSAATDLTFLYMAYANAIDPVTRGNGQVQVTYAHIGAGTHQSAISKTNGFAGTITQWMSMDGFSSRGAIGFSAKGFP